VSGLVPSQWEGAPLLCQGLLQHRVEFPLEKETRAARDIVDLLLGLLQVAVEEGQ